MKNVHITNEIDPPTYDESVKNVQRNEDKEQVYVMLQRFVNGKSFLLIYEARYYLAFNIFDVP